MPTLPWAASVPIVLEQDSSDVVLPMNANYWSHDWKLTKTQGRICRRCRCKCRYGHVLVTNDSQLPNGVPSNLHEFSCEQILLMFVHET